MAEVLVLVMRPCGLGLFSRVFIKGLVNKSGCLCNAFISSVFFFIAVTL